VERLGLLGHSRGGNQTARYAVARGDGDLVAVFLVAPQTGGPDATAAAYRARFGEDLGRVLERARDLVAEDRGTSMLEQVGFLHCADARVAAEAFLAYYAPDADMDTPRLIPAIAAPVVVFAGSADATVPGLVEAVEPLADGERVRLVVLEGADHFFRDLHSEDIADVVAEVLAGAQ
jgi:pimeloyl-ACP methyl ester carboxylesterase